MDGSESGILKPGSGSAKKSESIRIRIRNTDLNKKLIFYTVPVVCCTCPPIGGLVVQNIWWSRWIVTVLRMLPSPPHLHWCPAGCPSSQPQPHKIFPLVINTKVPISNSCNFLIILKNQLLCFMVKKKFLVFLIFLWNIGWNVWTWGYVRV